MYPNTEPAGFIPEEEIDLVRQRMLAKNNI